MGSLGKVTKKKAPLVVCYYWGSILLLKGPYFATFPYLCRRRDHSWLQILYIRATGLRAKKKSRGQNQRRRGGGEEEKRREKKKEERGSEKKIDLRTFVVMQEMSRFTHFGSQKKSESWVTSQKTEFAALRTFPVASGKKCP